MAQHSTNEIIARIVWETQRQVAYSQGVRNLCSWEERSDGEKAVTLNSVSFRLENRGAPAETQHDAWVEFMQANGWTHGFELDLANKTHPNLTAFSQLSYGQQVKEFVTAGIVDAVISSGLFVVSDDADDSDGDSVDGVAEDTEGDVADADAADVEGESPAESSTVSEGEVNAPAAAEDEDDEDEDDEDEDDEDEDEDDDDDDEDEDD